MEASMAFRPGKIGNLQINGIMSLANGGFTTGANTVTFTGDDAGIIINTDGPGANIDAAGGTLALSFIVAIALGICANTVLFLGSAVVVLERFARATHRPRSILIVTVAWAVTVSSR